MRFFLPLILISLFYFFLSAREVYFITADIGRHLSNGKYLFRFPELLSTNFYSYTYPTYPFFNHHWGSGVFFYSVFRYFGFTGISLTYLGICLAAILCLFWETKKQAGCLISSSVAIACLPLITSRNEIRPECFSLFFCSLFYIILMCWKREKKERLLYVLPVCMIAWANLHVYFLFGFFIFFSFLLENIWENKFNFKQCQTALKIFAICIVAALINPFGYRLLLTPLQMFQNFGYMLQENQSLYFLWNYGLIAPEYYPQLILSLLCFCALLANIFYIRQKSMFAISIITFSFCIMALVAVRNISFFGLFAMPYLAISIQKILEELQKRGLRKFCLEFSRYCTILFSFIGIIFLISTSKLQIPQIGLTKQIENSATFFKSNHLQGPIFNNYDIGGYLIYNLFPQEKVFVDNRPEAYPASFFKNTYIPMQENEEIWKQEEEAFGLNVIYFYWHDLTPWAQRFLMVRTQDPEWVPVYVDSYALILVKNIEKNRDLISKFQLPRRIFSKATKSPLTLFDFKVKYVFILS